MNKSDPTGSTSRDVWVNSHTTDEWQIAHTDGKKAPHYPSNRVRSTRYQWWNFIPKNIFEQFQRLANFYFLLIVVVQLVTPDNPIPAFTTWLPLVFVLLVTMVKQGYEDYLRFLADRKCNNAGVLIYNRIRDEMQHKTAGDIHIGHIIKLQRGQVAPCDLVLLETSHSNGICYINTASLDGERNLKERQAPEQIVSGGVHENLKNVCIRFHAAAPSLQLNQFRVTAVVFNTSRDTQPVLQVALNEEKFFMLRETRLVNTDWILGCALYTGEDTKIALNSQRKRLKRSSVERCLNSFIISYFCFILFCCVVLTLLQYVYLLYNRSLNSAWFLPRPYFNASQVVLIMLNFIILHHTMIPISLYVTIEIFKFFSLPFFNNDEFMLHGDQGPMANTSDLNEELGQIDYLFCDKTGTLTCNEMRFRKLADASGRVHLFENDNLVLEDDLDLSRRSRRDLRLMSSSSFRVSQSEDEDSFDIRMSSVALSRIRTSSFEESEHSDSGQILTAKRTSLQRIILAMILCHSARYDRDNVRYEAESPDEIAFLEACRSMDVIYLGHEEEDISVHRISYRNHVIRFRQHYLVKFTPERKMSTVLVENVANGKCYLLSKGADSAIYSKLANSPKSMKIKSIIEEQVEAFTSQGLRVLVFAEKKVTKSKMKELCDKLTQADLDPEISAKDTLLQEIEKDYILLGCTGVEDRLQDNVQGTISSLRKAGIQIWILTGDTLKTALNVSHMCGHSPKNAKAFKLVEQKTERDVLQRLTEYSDRERDEENVEKVNSLTSSSSSVPNYHSVSTSSTRGKIEEQIIVIDGESLGHILEGSDETKALFINVLLKFKSILCCRMSPLQKAAIVRMVRNTPNCRGILPITAAVGDGANDVSMILEAHVGFGLYGKEGTQATRASDFALAEFQDLRHAILFHGYNFYYRLSVMVLFFFYKNLVMGLGHFIYALFSGASGQSIYPSFYVMSYNTTLTAVVIFAYSLMDLPMDRDKILSQPWLYSRIRHNALLSWRRFLLWNALGGWHCLVIFCLPLWLTFSNDVIDIEGSPQSLYGLGTVAMTAVIVVVHIRIALQTHTFNWPMWLSYFVTFLLCAITMILCNYLLWEDFIPFYGEAMFLFSQPQIWFQLVLIVVVCIFPELIILAALHMFQTVPHPKTAHRRIAKGPWDYLFSDITFPRQQGFLELCCFTANHPRQSDYLSEGISTNKSSGKCKPDLTYYCFSDCRSSEVILS